MYFQWRQLSLGLECCSAVAMPRCSDAIADDTRPACHHWQYGSITPAAAMSHAVAYTRSMHRNIKAEPTTFWLWKVHCSTDLTKVEPVLCITWHRSLKPEAAMVTGQMLPPNLAPNCICLDTVAGEGRRWSNGSNDKQAQLWPVLNKQIVNISITDADHITT